MRTHFWNPNSHIFGQQFVFLGSISGFGESFLREGSPGLELCLISLTTFACPAPSNAMT